MVYLIVFKNKWVTWNEESLAEYTFTSDVSLKLFFSCYLHLYKALLNSKIFQVFLFYRASTSQWILTERRVLRRNFILINKKEARERKFVNPEQQGEWRDNYHAEWGVYLAVGKKESYTLEADVKEATLSRAHVFNGELSSSFHCTSGPLASTLHTFFDAIVHILALKKTSTILPFGKKIRSTKFLTPKRDLTFVIIYKS